VLVTSRPVFSLPFHSVREVMETRRVMAAFNIEAKRMEANEVNV